MALLRQGLARLLTDAGFDVAGSAGDAEELLDLVARSEPDAALIDIKMPPTHTDEGLRAAAVIRERHPKTAVLLLSSYLEARYAEALLKDHPAGSGYARSSASWPRAIPTTRFATSWSSPAGPWNPT